MGSFFYLIKKSLFLIDNLEYIFLDGKRPEEAAHRRKNDYYKKHWEIIEKILAEKVFK